MTRQVRLICWLAFGVLLVLLYGGIPIVKSGATLAKVYTEDGPVEWSGAISLFLAAALLFIAYRRQKYPSRNGLLKRRRNVILLLLAIVAFWGAGEEISWGQRIFHYATPRFMESANYQHEMNIHNLKPFGYTDSQGRARRFPWNLLDNGRLAMMFLFTVFLIIPLLSRYVPSPSRWLREHRVPIFPLDIGFMLLINYGVFQLFKLTLGDSSGTSLARLVAASEVKETMMEFLFFLGALSYIIMRTKPLEQS